MKVETLECPKCHRKQGERHFIVSRTPSDKQLEKWISDGIAKSTDGCKVEPDGYCSHGHSSWLLKLGYI